MSERDTREIEAVGASDMEAEHELLMAILHELQEALVAGRGEQVPVLLGRFEDAANAHFMEEQSLMRLHAYPGYAAHEQEHDALIEDLRVLAGRIGGGELSQPARAVKELEDWLMIHMNTTDEAFEEYMRQTGIRPS